MHTLLLTAVLLLAAALPAFSADPPPLITSHLGHDGSAFSPGVRPSTLGWGPDDRAYPGKFVVNPRDRAEMAWIPAGTFLMGTTPELLNPAHPEWSQDEQPAHEVRITRGFWMYRHEVTNEQFRRFRPLHHSGEYRGLSVDAEKMPAVSLDWTAASGYCAWAGVRLPTEAEWEYACRAGGSARYTWGNGEQNVGRYANVSDRTAQAKWPEFRIFDTDDGVAVSNAVGMYAPNAWGLHDMLGNVWEWCADFYTPDYYAVSPRDDPPGPEKSLTRVLRGGSWFTGPDNTYCTARFCYYAEDTCPGRGFRACVNP